MDWIISVPGFFVYFVTLVTYVNVLALKVGIQERPEAICKL